MTALEESRGLPVLTGVWGLSVLTSISYGKSQIEMEAQILLFSLHPSRTLTGPCCFVLCFRQHQRVWGNFSSLGILYF